MADEKIDRNESDEEWAKKLQKNYDRNKAYARADEYRTELNAKSEAQFRAWLNEPGTLPNRDGWNRFMKGINY